MPFTDGLLYSGYINYFLYMLPAYLLTLVIRLWLKSTVSKYSSVSVGSGIDGRTAAQIVLSRGGATGVRIGDIGGELTDYFDPSTNTIRLSAPVYAKRTVTAVGVAAHEAGHAVQYAEEYAPAKLRTATVKICNIGSRLAIPLIIVGWIFMIDALAYAGIICFSLVVLFQLITLPVEFDASRRAVKLLGESGMLSETELKGVRKVLTAAAMTYVGALATSVFQMLYYVSRTRRK